MRAAEGRASQPPFDFDLRREGAQRRAAAVQLRGRAAPEQGKPPKAGRVNLDPLYPREQQIIDWKIEEKVICFCI